MVPQWARSSFIAAAITAQKNNKEQNNSALIGKVFKCVTLCNQVQVGPIFHSMLSHVNDWPRGRVISVNLFRQRISFKHIWHFVFVFVWDNFLFFKCRSWHPAAQGITSGNGEPASPLTRLLHNYLSNLRSSTFFFIKAMFPQLFIRSIVDQCFFVAPWLIRLSFRYHHLKVLSWNLHQQESYHLSLNEFLWVTDIRNHRSVHSLIKNIKVFLAFLPQEV